MEKKIKEFLTELGYSEDIIDSNQENRVNEWLHWLGGKTKYHKYYIYNGRRKNECTMKSLNIAAQSCGDLADFFFNEKLDITIDNEQIDKTLKEYLEQNDFLQNSNKLMQLTKALGTGAYITYLDNGVLRINYVNATNLIILDGNATECKSLLTWTKKKVIGGEELYINAHILTDNGYVIYNKKYLLQNGAREYVELDLGDSAVIETHSFIPKFAVITTPEINNIDINSAYGISAYANALDNILSIDNAYDSLDNEIKLGRKRVYVKGGATKFNIAEDGSTTPIFDTTDVAYYQLPGEENDPLITESSFDLRIEELTQALQAQLNMFTAKVGLGHNYYKFKDGETYVNTSNVMSANSDVYRKIKKQENIITKAITQLLYGIAELTGVSDKFNVSVFYDDSIIEDTETIRKQSQTEYNTGLISKAQYYRDVYKLGDEEAKQFASQMIEEIQEERINDGTEFDFTE